MRVGNVLVGQLEKYPSWPKGLPWKGSRSLVAARGFKSHLLRLNERSFISCSGQAEALAAEGRTTMMQQQKPIAGGDLHGFCFICEGTEQMNLDN